MSSPDIPAPIVTEHRLWLLQAMKVGAKHHVRHARPWAHNLVNLSIFGGNLALLVGLLAMGSWTPWWLHVLVAGPLFGLGCYTLIAFVVHEASHDLFILNVDKVKRRTWNRFFGWFCSVPFGLHYINHWEEGHRVHHAHPLEPVDPQRFNVATGWPLARLVLAFVLIPFYAHLYRLFGKRPAGRSRSSPLVLVGYVLIWAVVGGLSVHAWGWSSLAVIVWGQQWTNVLNQIKGALEHGGAAGSDPELLLRSRSTLFPLLGMLGIYNATIYHFEHHLHVKVPWYALAAYHREIAALVPERLRPDVFNRRILDQLRGRLGASGQGPLPHSPRPA